MKIIHTFTVTEHYSYTAPMSEYFTSIQSMKRSKLFFLLRLFFDSFICVRVVNILIDDVTFLDMKYMDFVSVFCNRFIKDARKKKHSSQRSEDKKKLEIDFISFHLYSHTDETVNLNNELEMAFDKQMLNHFK